jgi:hypothetical protein
MTIRDTSHKNLVPSDRLEYSPEHQELHQNDLFMLREFTETMIQWFIARVPFAILLTVSKPTPSPPYQYYTVTVSSHDIALCKHWQRPLVRIQLHMISTARCADIPVPTHVPSKQLPHCRHCFFIFLGFFHIYRLPYWFCVTSICQCAFSSLSNPPPQFFNEFYILRCLSFFVYHFHTFQ